ncbi:MAG: tetratricopeptide repeat protein [Hyphomicrobium sp.]
MTSIRRALAILAVVFVLGIGIGTWFVGWQRMWASPDQRGRYLFEHDRYAEAAKVFVNPMWRGVAQMRAADFKGAEQSFAGIDTAEGAFNHGNALVMMGQYEDAMGRYDRALALKPDWPQAKANREIARVRAERVKAPGGDQGDQRLGADEIVFDKDAKKPGGQETQTTGGMDDKAVRALWLKRVQTKPADFLRSRFGYQLEAQEKGKEPKLEAQP